MRYYKKICVLLLWLIFSACAQQTDPWSGEIEDRLEFIEKKLSQKSYVIPFPKKLVPKDYIDKRWVLSRHVHSLLRSCPKTSVLICNWEQWVVITASWDHLLFMNRIVPIVPEFIGNKQFKAFIAEHYQYQTPYDIISTSYESLEFTSDDSLVVIVGDTKKIFKGVSHSQESLESMPDDSLVVFVRDMMKIFEKVSSFTEFLELLTEKDIPIMMLPESLSETPNRYIRVPWGLVSCLLPDTIAEPVAKSLGIAVTIQFFKNLQDFELKYIGFSNSEGLFHWSESVNAITRAVEFMDDRGQVELSDSLLTYTYYNILMSYWVDYLPWRIEREQRLGRDAFQYANRLLFELRRSNDAISPELTASLIQLSKDVIGSYGITKHH